MALNQQYDEAKQLHVPVASGVVSGDPVSLGTQGATGLPGVALTSRDSAGEATVCFGGAFRLSVKGVDGVGNSAVAVGDMLYFLDADTPKISKKATGTPFGWALGAVDSGATATILVKVMRS